MVFFLLSLDFEKCKSESNCIETVQHVLSLSDAFCWKASVRSLYLLCFVANEVIGIDCRCVKVVCTYLTYH